MEKRKILVVFGTRPEAIKLAPVIRALESSSELVPRICVTGQHREMLDQMLSYFGLRPDHDLAVMQSNQDLTELTARLLTGLRAILAAERPDAVLVQGDTTTTFATTLSAYYQRIPTGHVEAGLRTGDPYNPFPEEINRRLTTHLASWHFAPTPWARDNLLGEGIPADRILVSGNTIVDAIQQLLTWLDAQPDENRTAVPETLLEHRRLIMVTSHRRESFGKGLQNICAALRDIADQNEDVIIVYPVHLNPHVREPVHQLLGHHPRIMLTAPLDYPAFIHLMRRAHLAITDSGGVQEEGPSLAVPVLVVRDRTERPEGVEAGIARLVGTRRDGIVAAATDLLRDASAHRRMACATNPYGDGHAAERIVSWLANALRPAIPAKKGSETL